MTDPTCIVAAVALATLAGIGAACALLAWVDTW